jgi:hypothetical protein
MGLTVSVGVAPNRLMAKLASGAAKPDGVRLVADQQAALQLLSQVGLATSPQLSAVYFKHDARLREVLAANPVCLISASPFVAHRIALNARLGPAAPAPACRPPPASCPGLAARQPRHLSRVSQPAVPAVPAAALQLQQECEYLASAQVHTRDRHAPSFGTSVSTDPTFCMDLLPCPADGISAATDLQRYSQQQLESELGLKPAAAAQLAQWCRGLDATPVQERGPPKTLSVQMSLTPQLLKMHPSQGPTVSASGGRAGKPACLLLCLWLALLLLCNFGSAVGPHIVRT